MTSAGQGDEPPGPEPPAERPPTESPAAEPPPRPPAEPPTTEAGPSTTPEVPPAVRPTQPLPASTPAPAVAGRSVGQRAKRPRESRPLALANLALGRSEVAFIAILAIGEAMAFAQHLFGHLARSPVTAARIGGLYVFAALRVPIQISATGSGVRGTFLDFSVAMLTITAVAVVLLFRGGSSAGDRAGGGVVRRVLWGALVGLPFGLFCWLLSLLVPFHFAIPVIEGGQVLVQASKGWALGLGLAVGVGSGALGGAWSRVSSLPASATPAPGVPPVRPAVRIAGGAMAGAGRMFFGALGLAFLGLLVLAGLNPDATRGYLDRSVGGGRTGLDLLAHHVLLLPNQSLLVLVPAMGGCDHVEGTTEPGSFLCYSRFPVHGDVNLTAPLVTGSGGRRSKSGLVVSPFADVRFRDVPDSFWLFLLVPGVAALAGGLRAGKRIARRRDATIAGALAGVGFALLVAVASVMASLSLRFFGGAAPAHVTVGPDPVAGGTWGLVWGVLGGAVGAAVTWRRPPPLRTPPPAQRPATPAEPASSPPPPLVSPPPSASPGPPASGP